MIDTHVWLWWIGRIPRLPQRLQKQLDEMTERPLLSVASLWELSLLVEAGRVSLAPSPEEWLHQALQPGAIRLAQVSREVALELVRFPSSFHRDPADRLIVATARALKVPLLTYDKQIRSSGLVKLWKEK